jgi:small nuclear ribonucleoprotein (snRNP)-like protein
MNLVIDDAVEVQLPTKDHSGKRRQLGMSPLTTSFEGILLTSAGQILLKGDNVSLIQAID